MKIRLTEEQYKRIFLSEQDYWDFDQSGTPYDEFQKTGKLRVSEPQNTKKDPTSPSVTKTGSINPNYPIINLDKFTQSPPSGIEWRPKGYSAEELSSFYLKNLKNDNKIAAKDGCQCDCYMGNCIYRCSNKSSVLHGLPCGETAKKWNLAASGMNLRLGNESGYALINTSIGIYNDAIKHKFNIQFTFGWTSSNEKADESFFGEGNIKDKLNKIPKTSVISPEYIGTILDAHLRYIDKFGDKEKEEITKKFNQEQAVIGYNNRVAKLKEDGWSQTLPSTFRKGLDIVKTEKLTKPLTGEVDIWYKVENPSKLNYYELQHLENQPGWSEPDFEGGSWSHVPNPKVDFNLPKTEKIKLKFPDLSEFEKQTKSLEEILAFINNHNQEILKQTINLYNKAQCGKSTGYSYDYYDISGKPISAEKAKSLRFGVTRTTHKKPSRKQMCKWGNSGVWIYETNNSNVFKCDCVDSSASKQQYMGDYGTVSSEMTGSVDIRSDWKKFTDSLTWHTAFQAASAVLVWFPPYGTAAAAGLEVLDGLLYLHEGDTFSGGLTIAFSLLPASKLFKGFKAIGSGGVEKIHKIIKNSEKIKSNTAKLQQMIKQAHKELDGKELKAFYDLINNPQDVIKVNNKLKTLEGLTSKDKFIKLAEDINDNTRLKEVIKEMEPMARKKILGDMTDSEKIVYSTLLGGTTPLTMDDKTGEKEEKSPEDIQKELTKGDDTRRVLCKSEQGKKPCMNCVYVPCGEGMEDFAELFNSVVKGGDPTLSDSEIDEALDSLELF